MDVVNKCDTLKEKLQDLDYRAAYAEGFLDDSIALRIRALRDHRGMKQEHLAAIAGMKQGAISRIEQADYGKWTISTLKKIARALDVPLSVRFESWGEFLDEVASLSPERLAVPTFETDPAFAEVPPALGQSIVTATTQAELSIASTEPTAVIWQVAAKARTERRLCA